MERKPRMLTTVEYAEKHKLSVDTVYNWCRRNALPGMQILDNSGKVGAKKIYMIPENAESSMRRKKAEPKSAAARPMQRLKNLQTAHDKSEHIRKFAVTRTFRQLCAETGLSHMEVRRIYDRLHERYGI